MEACTPPGVQRALDNGLLTGAGGSEHRNVNRHRPPHAGTTTWLECLEEEVLRVGSGEKGRTFGSRLASKIGDERAQVASRLPENTP